MKNYVLFFVFSSPIFSLIMAQGDLKAAYYNGTNFEEYVGTGSVSNLDLYWDYHPPFEGVISDNCSVIYTGLIKTSRSGEVEFSARVDDGIMLWVGEVMVFSNWRLNDVGDAHGKIYLEGNTDYKFTVKYFNAMNEAELKLYWKLPENPDNNWLENLWYGDDPVIIPSESFSPPLETSTVSILVPEPEIEFEIKFETEPEPVLKAEPEPEPVPETASEPVFEPKPELNPEPEVLTKEVIEKYLPKTVEFEKAKSEILPVSFPDLDKLASFMKRHRFRQLIIEGHTDNVGDPQKNLILSEERARVIAAYLIERGVDAEQIMAIGYGDTRPISIEDGRKYHPENRRVEFMIE